MWILFVNYEGIISHGSEESIEDKELFEMLDIRKWSSLASSYISVFGE
jgi:hypothetical protein